MKAKVLIADDERTVCESLAKVLHTKGYEVSISLDGIEAFETYKRSRPDLVVLDLNMPRRNGWDTLEKINTLNPLTPIILITGRPDQLEQAEAARVGALIEKPLDVELLIETVRNLIDEPVSTRLRRITFNGPGTLYSESLK